MRGKTGEFRPGRLVLPTAAALFLAAVLAAGAARAGEKPPLRSMIIAMAQHFVQERFMADTEHYHRVEFDVAYLHPQPSGDFWAVVGGFVTDQNTPNTYVAAVRLVCAEHGEVECWRLEKLAINGEILLNETPPL